MSGGFAIPVVFSEPALLAGWVPVAPVSITSHKLSEYQALRLPVLAVYGENDNQFRNQVRYTRLGNYLWVLVIEFMFSN